MIKRCVVSASLVSAVLTLVTLAAQPSPQPSKRLRWKWVGEQVREEAYSGPGAKSAGGASVAAVFARSVHIKFTYIQESDEQGRMRFTSRKINWSARGVSEAPDGIWSMRCEGSGGIELGSANSVDSTTREQDEDMKVPCEEQKGG